MLQTHDNLKREKTRKEKHFSCSGVNYTSFVQLAVWPGIVDLFSGLWLFKIRALAPWQSKGILYLQILQGGEGFQGVEVRRSGTGHSSVRRVLCVAVTVTKERECEVCQKSGPGKTWQRCRVEARKKSKVKTSSMQILGGPIFGESPLFFVSLRHWGSFRLRFPENQVQWMNGGHSSGSLTANQYS